MGAVAGGESPEVLPDFAAVGANSGFNSRGRIQRHPHLDRLAREGWIHRRARRIDYAQPIADAPTDHGFDQVFGLPASLDMRDYVYFEGNRVVEQPTSAIAGSPNSVPAYHRAGRAGPTFRPENVLAQMTDRAVRYVRERDRDAKPFFLYLALTSPHTPVLPTARFAGRTGLGTYADFVAETDASVGAVLQALEDTGAARNTIVIFASDNGPAPIAGMIDDLRAKGHDSTAGWRGAKQDLLRRGPPRPVHRSLAWCRDGRVGDERHDRTD